jgi:hypothetical protein
LDSGSQKESAEADTAGSGYYCFVLVISCLVIEKKNWSRAGGVLNAPTPSLGNNTQSFTEIINKGR